MPDPFFYLFAAVAVTSGALVVFKRDPIVSAVFLIVALCNIAAIYLFFGAGFLAAIQIIVYAGAVMVLFLFIIMLLPAGADHEEGGPRFKQAAAGAALLFAVELFMVIMGTTAGKPEPVTPAPGTPVTISNIGQLLFGRYLVPFELVSFLLLVAVIGVVMLTGADLKKLERNRS